MEDQKLRFQNKVAIVTGGTSGMGKAVAFALLELGSSVVLASIEKDAGESLVKELKSQNKSVAFYCGDLSQETEIQGMIELAIKEFGRLDMACNCAGVDIRGTVIDISKEDYDRIFSINTWGVLAAMKHQIPEMLKVGGGSIVNISSIAAIDGCPGLSIYSGSKHAVQGMSKSVALEFARYNVRVNTVAPGVILTPMVERDLPTVEAKAAVESIIPMGRFGKPEDVANAVVFLLDPINTYITGSTLTVDGGWTAQ